MGQEKPDAEDKRTVEEKMKGRWLARWPLQRYRAKGVPIGLAPDPRTGHECGDSRYLAIPFLDACLAMRLPDKGAQGSNLKTDRPEQGVAGAVAGRESRACRLLPGQSKGSGLVAQRSRGQAWMEYVKTGAVGDTNAAAAPNQRARVVQG